MKCLNSCGGGGFRKSWKMFKWLCAISRCCVAWGRDNRLFLVNTFCKFSMSLLSSVELWISQPFIYILKITYIPFGKNSVACGWCWSKTSCELESFLNADVIHLLPSDRLALWRSGGDSGMKICSTDGLRIYRPSLG